ncbi:MAG: flagellar basal body rod protein FlgC [Terracidiphilus sp.]
MNLFAMMESSGGAMEAERMRAEVVATNMANAETSRTESGEPYRRQMVVFAANPGDPEFARSFSAAQAAGEPSESGVAGSGDLPPLLPLPAPLTPLGPENAQTAVPGVHIAAVVQDTSAPIERYDPGNPEANAQGYVAYPNINPLTEMVDLMGATRAYGLNNSAVQAEKEMISSALEIAKS